MWEADPACEKGLHAALQTRLLLTDPDGVDGRVDSHPTLLADPGQRVLVEVGVGERRKGCRVACEAELELADDHPGGQQTVADIIATGVRRPRCEPLPHRSRQPFGCRKRHGRKHADIVPNMRSYCKAKALLHNVISATDEPAGPVSLLPCRWSGNEHRVPPVIRITEAHRGQL
jgi:hypothetical protein